VRWVEVVEAEAAAVVVLGVAADVDRAGWAALRPAVRAAVRAATAFAPIAGTERCMRPASLATRRNALSVAHR